MKNRRWNPDTGEWDEIEEKTRLNNPRNVWNPNTGEMEEIEEEELLKLPLPEAKPIERRVKHILFYDKQSGKVVAHMEVAEDLVDLAKIHNEHNVKDHPLAAAALESREFKLPLPDGKSDKWENGVIPEDLTIDHIDTKTGKLKGKFAGKENS